MELIPVINFEALNNPSFFSRIISIFELGKISQAHRLWKYGAFLVALVYAFNCVANKLMVLIRHYHDKSKSFLANSEPFLYCFDDELYSSDDEDDVVSVSSDDEESSEEEKDQCEFNRLLSYEDLSMYEDDFTVKGQNRKMRVLRRRKSLGDDFSLSDLVYDNGVVKLWDGFGLGVEKSFPFLELNKDEWKRFGSFFGSPSVVATEPEGVLGLNVWDFRCPSTEPAVQAIWRSDRKGKVIGGNVNRTGAVCVRDDVTRRLTVADVRKVETPVAECEEMWWDADE
ncbi:uncharacterized protein LOC141641812 [Silene latifolia]|uniref:uncharacterized protein LOC141641812 n=1 Tax=Silene latifolia TaxID=37657 RepID=UPI003D77C13C